jgi:hypothetical protein
MCGFHAQNTGLIRQTVGLGRGLEANQRGMTGFILNKVCQISKSPKQSGFTFCFIKRLKENVVE